jgi:ribosomal protein L30/L7E
MRWIYDEERTENTNEGLRLNKMDNSVFTHKAQ